MDSRTPLTLWRLRPARQEKPNQLQALLPVLQINSHREARKLAESQP